MSAPPARIVLVGFMGAGKSTVGPLLARELGWDFVDLDHQVERRLGMTVAEIFARHGEGRFREAEEEEARAAAGRRGLVVAAGGGAFAQPRTREVLQEGALTVWLRCGLSALLTRIAEGGDRPLARNRETIASLLVEREPSYRRADLTVDTTEAAPDAAAREIVAGAARVGVAITRSSSG